ncbi:hypothetical protein [Actinoplanes regularis]|uniref:hypothetical protein n=1 Tax=Actinoplanes regularis TaxID=52697 RepID=UPI0024A4013C|nr:hypothetical protein [Actinoplanes regularis]GLW31012.1 hypothetical protein Areg01_39520 [Actinoplanes regularis]
MNWFGEIWPYVWPVAALIGGLGLLWSAIATPAGRLPGPKTYWVYLGLLVMWTGDAAVGEARPLFERAGKGAVAAPAWIALAVVLVRRRRHRLRSAAAAEQPEDAPSRSTAATT